MTLQFRLGLSEEAIQLISLDPLLLCAFAEIPDKSRVADLGTGTLEPSEMRARSHRPTEAVNLTLHAKFARWFGRVTR